MTWIEQIENALSNGSFWFYYETNKSPADGHCLLHSVVSVWYAIVNKNK